MRRSALLLAAVAASGLGCGDDPEVRRVTVTEVQTEAEPVPEGGRLSRADTLTMHLANVTVSQHCLSETVPESRLERDVAALVEVAEREPDTLSTPLGEGGIANTPREELTEVVNRLEQDRCAPGVMSAARRALGALPAAP